MRENSNHEKTILRMKKGYLFLAVIIISLLMICVAFITTSKENTASLLNVAFDLLSGALVPLIYLRIVSGNNTGDSIQGEYARAIEKICEDVPTADAGLQAQVYGGIDEAELKSLIKNAKRRVWIMGSDLTRRVTRNKRELVWAAQHNPDISIRLLMIDPENIFTLCRYSEIDYDTPKEFYDALRSSCGTIANMIDDIRKEYPLSDISARMYATQPTTVIMLIDDQLFVSNYVLNHRTSNSLVVRYQIDAEDSCKAYRDFIQGHFEREWSRAKELDMHELPLAYEPEKLSSLGRDCSYQFQVVKKHVWSYDINMLLRKVGRAIQNFWNEHSDNLPPALLAIAFALGLLTLLDMEFGKASVDASAYEILCENILSMVVGMIIGSILSVAEYFLEVKKLNRLERQEFAAHNKTMIELENHIFRSEENMHGVHVFANRDEAELERRIRAAQKRVWVYATNHTFLSSNNIEDAFHRDCDCDYRFLLLKPTSLFLITRYLDIPDKQIPEEFSIEIASQLSKLRKKSSKMPHLQVRLYTRRPNFMLYIIDDVLILSCITSNGKARDQIHIALDMGYPSIRALAGPFLDHFAAVWEEAEECTKRNTERIQSGNMQVDMIDKQHMTRLLATPVPLEE